MKKILPSMLFALQGRRMKFLLGATKLFNVYIVLSFYINDHCCQVFVNYQEDSKLIILSFYNHKLMSIPAHSSLWTALILNKKPCLSASMVCEVHFSAFTDNGEVNSKWVKNSRVGRRNRNKQKTNISHIYKHVCNQ